MLNTYEITENIKEFILGGKADFTILQEGTDRTKEQQYKSRRILNHLVHKFGMCLLS